MDNLDDDALSAFARPASLSGMPAKSTGVGPAPGPGALPIASVKFLGAQEPDSSMPSGFGSRCANISVPVDATTKATTAIAVSVTRLMILSPLLNTSDRRASAP